MTIDFRNGEFKAMNHFEYTIKHSQNNLLNTL